MPARTGSTNTGASGHSMVLSAAQAMVGGVLSSTVIVWLHVAVLPHSSVAVQVRLVAYLILPVGQVPAMGVSMCARVTVPHKSVGTGSTNCGVGGHSMVLSAAQAMVGGVLSSTVIVWLHVAVLPHSSVAV